MVTTARINTRYATQFLTKTQLHTALKQTSILGWKNTAPRKDLGDKM